MVALQLIMVIILALTLILLLIYALYQAPRQRIGYIPLPARAVPAVVQALDISGTESAMLADLGCGDGRVLQAALRAHPELKGLGIEINPIVTFLAHWRLRSAANRVRLVRGNLFQADLSRTTHVFTYLNPPTMAKLEAKLAKELPKGCRVVSCDFALPTRKPARIINIGEAWQLGQKLYIYEY